MGEQAVFVFYRITDALSVAVEGFLPQREHTVGHRVEHAAQADLIRVIHQIKGGIAFIKGSNLLNPAYFTHAFPP